MARRRRSRAERAAHAVRDMVREDTLEAARRAVAEQRRRNRHLPPAERIYNLAPVEAVVGAITDRSNRAGKDAYPRHDTIGEQIGRSQWTSKRAVRTIKVLGLLEVLPPGTPDENGRRRRSNTYRCVPPAPAEGEAPSYARVIWEAAQARHRGAEAAAELAEITAPLPPAEEIERPPAGFTCPEPGCGWQGPSGPCQAVHDYRGPP